MGYSDILLGLMGSSDILLGFMGSSGVLLSNGHCPSKIFFYFMTVYLNNSI